MSFLFLLTYFTTALSYIALTAVLLRLLYSFPSIHFHLSRLWRWAGDLTEVYQTFVLPKLDANSRPNPMYRKAVRYISGLPSSAQSDRCSVFSSATRTNTFTFQLAPGQTAVDSFQRARITWIRPSDGEERLEMRIRRQDRVRILRPYLHYVEHEAEKYEMRQRQQQLFGQPGVHETMWVPLPLTHPCDMTGFKVLAKSYLGLSEHLMFEPIEEEIKRGAKMSLAEVAELVVEHREVPRRALHEVMDALVQARRNAEAEREREREAAQPAVRGGRLERAKRAVRRVLSFGSSRRENRVERWIMGV